LLDLSNWLSSFNFMVQLGITNENVVMS